MKFLLGLNDGLFYAEPVNGNVDSSSDRKMPNWIGQFTLTPGWVSELKASPPWIYTGSMAETRGLHEAVLKEALAPKHDEHSGVIIFAKKN